MGGFVELKFVLEDGYIMQDPPFVYEYRVLRYGGTEHTVLQRRMRHIGLGLRLLPAQESDWGNAANMQSIERQLIRLMRDVSDVRGVIVDVPAEAIALGSWSIYGDTAAAGRGDGTT